MSLSIQNRTFEFQQCVTSYDKINRKQHNYIKPNNQEWPPKKSKFSQQASIIAKDIVHVTELLSKLALLAKRKPLFDDKPVEIGELTYVIKQEIFKIEQNMQNLQRFVKGDASVVVDSQTTQFSKNVLNLLNSKMKNVSGEFKNVLEIRQKNEIMNKNRTENFLSAASNHRSSNNPSPLVESGDHLSNLGENPYLMNTQRAESPLPYDPDADPDVSYPYSNGEYLSIPNQTQQMLLMEEQGGQYLQQRNRAVETIESTINEVGNLFQQLATMVSEQGEQIQRIDENVEDISLNISGAQRELLKYYAHITSNRWLFLKIFGVLIVFFFLWVLVS
ncbi:SNARE protein SED5/Syntaxin 5 [Scheffersomyces stipitis CBS 6054]|uniref:SNARE protein SED5/Syntaxin 5 n=1 Tax=Scheffersomyces stipitis (strain ATCC 58785 / CBS 6054 / NBRC 10063 / NRRL Y-11545) TaxID=322104 RepID=A3LX44_PICST|nr:SNARE protein SED5/Syntaxin 5 [Scheffersomyces stipitis CBS 6054]ABN67402.2 SNARE protein SED5/Syntaxin 5 [Scheffersomyces stipitis CBS 6054]